MLVGQATAGPEKTLTLKLEGGKTGPPGSSCGVRPRWTYYGIGGTVRYTGRVSPAPSGAFRVKIVVRRCFGSTFDVVKTQTARGRPGGAFSGSLPVRVRSDCFVRASYGGKDSGRAYFRVR